MRPGTKHQTASGLIENRGQFVLIFHHKIGLWLYPGGHVEQDEEPQDALLREVSEEINAEVSISTRKWDELLSLDDGSVVELPQPIAILCEKIAERPREPAHWHIDLIYLCHMDDATRNGLAASEDTRWVTPAEAASLPCPPELPALMRRALRMMAD